MAQRDYVETPGLVFSFATVGRGPGPVSFPYSPKHCKVAALLLGERTLSVTVLDHLQLATMKQVPSVFI